MGKVNNNHRHWSFDWGKEQLFRSVELLCRSFQVGDIYALVASVWLPRRTHRGRLTTVAEVSIRLLDLLPLHSHFGSLPGDEKVRQMSPETANGLEGVQSIARH